MKLMISIVVPVYNVEKELPRCVNSLINQTYENIEIILVDDGSKDLSGKLCDEYGKIDKRINVIHKQNGGLSDARNFGIKTALGDYILFVDSDDYIELNACERLVEKIDYKSNIDIVTFSGNEQNGIKKKIMNRCGKEKIISGKDYIYEKINNGYMNIEACLYLYRREYLLKNDFYFKVGLLHEDFEFTFRTVFKAEKIYIVDILVYNYIRRDNSISLVKNFTKNALHIKKTCLQHEKYFKDIADNKLYLLIMDQCVVAYLSAFTQGVIDVDKKNEFIDRKFVKKHAYKRKTKCKAILFCLSPNLYYVIHKKIKGCKNG